MRLLAILAATLLVAVPATAHTTVPAADGQICLTVGSLNEPISTFVQSGLDLTVRENLDPDGDCASADRGEEVADFHNTIVSAVAVSPSGAERDLMDIRVQHGSVGRYTSGEPYQWTEPGQYVLRLEGEYNGVPYTGEYLIAGPVDGVEDTFHPPLDRGATVAALQERIAELEADLASLSADVASLQAAQPDGQEPDDNDAAGVPLLLAGLGLVGVALLARRR